VERQTELTAESLWNDVSARLREALNDTTYSTWFGEVDGEKLDRERLVLGVPNDFTREWIEGHFLDLIRATVRDVAGGERQVTFRVIETAPPQPAGSAVPASVTPLPIEVTQRSEIAGINPKYTFDSFVIGSSTDVTSILETTVPPSRSVMSNDFIGSPLGFLTPGRSSSV